MDRKRGWWAYAGVAFVSLVLALGLYVEAYCTLVRPTDCTDIRTGGSFVALILVEGMMARRV